MSSLRGDVYAEGQVNFVKVIPLDGSVNFCEKFVVRGREFDISLNHDSPVSQMNDVLLYARGNHVPSSYRDRVL